MPPVGFEPTISAGERPQILLFIIQNEIKSLKFLVHAQNRRSFAAYVTALFHYEHKNEICGPTQFLEARKKFNNQIRTFHKLVSPIILIFDVLNLQHLCSTYAYKNSTNISTFHNKS